MILVGVQSLAPQMLRNEMVNSDNMALGHLSNFAVESNHADKVVIRLTNCIDRNVK